jgi:hypothetical protein
MSYTFFFSDMPGDFIGAKITTTCDTINIEQMGENEYRWNIAEVVRGFKHKGSTIGSLEDAKREAVEAATKVVDHLIAQDQGQPGDTIPQRVRGLPRPTITYNAYGESVSERENPSDGYRQRFGRRRELPVMYSTSEGSKSSTICSSGRLLEVFYDFLCSCCGEKIEEMPDKTGWIVDDRSQWGTPGGAMCTHCTNLCLRLCPHFALEREKGRVELYRITAGGAYKKNSEGGAMPDLSSEHAHVSSLEEFAQYLKAARKTRSEAK